MTPTLRRWATVLAVCGVVGGCSVGTTGTAGEPVSSAPSTASPSTTGSRPATPAQQAETAAAGSRENPSTSAPTAEPTSRTAAAAGSTTVRLPTGDGLEPGRWGFEGRFTLRAGVIGNQLCLWFEHGSEKINPVWSEGWRAEFVGTRAVVYDAAGTVRARSGQSLVIWYDASSGPEAVTCRVPGTVGYMKVFPAPRQSR